MSKKPTIAGLQRDLSAAEAAHDEEKARRIVAERNAETWKQKHHDAVGEAGERENDLRDQILELTTENARMRGYLDRIEDSTPVVPESRFSRSNEMRARHTGRGDHFAMMGVERKRGPRPWHHK